MPQTIWREIWILVGIAITSLVLGLITGRLFLIAAIGFGLYIFFTLRHLQRLRHWLRNRQQAEIPDAGGLWGDVFDEIRQLMKQTENREDRLNDMLTRFQSAAAAMPDAMVILSQESDIEWANPSAGRLFGIRYPRDAGTRLFNLLRDPDFVQYLQHGDYSELLEIDSPENSEIKLSIQVTPFGSLQKLVIGRDVTRLARLEQMRRHFVANVSHELRTPLTVLGGFVETLGHMDQIRMEDLKKYLATMQEQAVRMQRLVDDLLMLSKLETAAPRTHDETVDVTALLAGLKEQAELLSGEQHHVITVETDKSLRLLGSREELLSAFSNLVNNAVRYTPAGGRIALAWKAAPDGSACFSVSDTGEGIALEHVPHLTERFYRVDTARSRASGGTGLGLSIVKHVLLRHDARLDIESEPGVGSTFTCVFPTARARRVDHPVSGIA
ncbi:histidine kinase [Sulfuricaulis limicola]|uniref:Phosphate regulon sensor protein PhoR n=1 Tax=Sulfuricaulis limicola TaxID=1620215 RepID=A0A1B4XCZ7_9GAMM|nr:phosphate regulon sensor histidine kinase PhoR [Sulfuricaulis limicola]BAV32678.1 histidine kinase [Sulfuricaulis limicola]